MIPSELSGSSLSAALQDVSLLYLDGYFPEMGLAVAKQVINSHLLQHHFIENHMKLGFFSQGYLSCLIFETRLSLNIY